MSLQLTVHTIDGRTTPVKSHNIRAGFGRLSIRNGGKGVIDITVDTFTGSGHDFQERPDEFITVYYIDGKEGRTWAGTAAELAAILKNHKTPQHPSGSKKG